MRQVARLGHSELARPLASREALTYRAARWIATCAGPEAEGSLAEPTMLWPFNHFRKPRTPLRGTIEAIYGMIVTQAREPLFYRDFGVPDTVNGRFDLLLLHLWLVLRRLKSVEGGAALSQALFDHFCNDMDDNLREMGVGDLTVPKRMQAFGEAFYGRTAAYDLALTEGREAAGAGAVQEYPERREHRKGPPACRLCRGGDGCSGPPRRGGAGERFGEVSLAGEWRAAMSKNEADREARSMARPRRGGADTGDRPASRHRGRSGHPRRDGRCREACARCCRCRPRST